MSWPAGAVLGGAWICGVVAGVVVLPASEALVAAGLLGAAAAAASALTVRPLLLPAALAVALLGLARADLAAPDPGLPLRALAESGSTVVLSGTATSDPRLRAGGFEVMVAPDHLVAASGPLAPAGRVLLLVRGPGAVSDGDRVTASGRLRLPVDRPGFDRRGYLAQQGAFLEMPVTRVDVIEPGVGPRALPGWIRARYLEAVGALLPEPHAAVLVGVVLGIRAGVPADLQRDLVATGLVHLLVLSGLKVAVFARITDAALRPLLGRLAIAPVLALVALYALAGGGTPAAVRAAAMGGLAALGGHLGQPSHVWTSLALVGAAMLGWKPELAWDVGFQLSFIGTAAIVLYTPAIERRLSIVPSLLREPFAVTLAAQVGTIPLMATDFHLVSPVAPLANALVLPLLPFMVGAGLLLPLLAPLGAVGRELVLPLVGQLAYLEQVARLLAPIPAAALPAPDLSGWSGAAYYGALGAVTAAAGSTGRRRSGLLATAVILPLVVGGGELAAWGQGPPSVAVLNVGAGQAVLLTGPSGAVLVDGGPSPARLTAELGQRLPPWKRSLDGLLITGAGQSNLGGLTGLDRTTAVVAIPDASLPGTVWRVDALAAAARGASIWRLRAGQRFELAGLRFEVLAPVAAADPDPAATGLAFRVRGPSGRAFCDLGDLDPDSQIEVASRLSGGCDYLLLPGGGTSAPAPELLAAARPSLLVAAMAGGRLARGISPDRVRRTDQEGTVLLPL